ncbi:MAG TPA: class I SAM-dependent methyltransferase [Alphaproteobacteria bacterium]|nr:class I SAM-dependent methyltransferase [Alphaproteobacteria bacterium]
MTDASRPARTASHLSPAGRLAYGLSQAARVAWFYTQYRMAARRVARGPRRSGKPPRGMPSTGDVLGRLHDLMLRDLANIEAGIYGMPHDWLPRPLSVLRASRLFFADLVAVDRRRRARLVDEVYDQSRRNRAKRSYPRYYLQNFHFQTDGYLSDVSAELYDYQVEVLFYGAADAMRRQALVPLRDFLAPRRLAETSLLDVAAGTGRFLTFVKDTYPDLPVIALDLSPYYLRRARAVLARESRRWFINAPAEMMPLKDASIDVATCVYLFHELPPRVRLRVAREIARVLKPGGRLIFVDSLQHGDDQLFDPLLDLFPMAYHEPYYRSFARTNLNRLFADAGLTCTSADVAFFSKVMVLEKPS